MTSSENLTFSSSKKKTSYYSSCIRVIKYLDMNLHRLELKDIMLSITSNIIQVLLVLTAGCFPMGSIRARSKAVRGHQNSPRHWAPQWEWEWVKVELGCGSCVGPTQQGPWPGRAGMWGAGDQSCCGISGADSPGGMKEGPGTWAAGREHGRGWAGTARAGSALRTHNDYSDDFWNQYPAFLTSHCSGDVA